MRRHQHIIKSHKGSQAEHPPEDAVAPQSFPQCRDGKKRNQKRNRERCKKN